MTRSPSTRRLPAHSAPSSSSSSGAKRARSKGEALELLRIGEAAHPVAHEDQVVLLHRPAARVVCLGGPKRSLMILKTTLRLGSAKTTMTSPLSPSAISKRASCVLQVAEQRRAPARSCRACDSRSRCRARPAACAASGSGGTRPSRGADHLDVEVGAGEGEDDADLVRRGEHRVDPDAPGAWTSASTSGRTPSPVRKSADQVGALVPVEGDRAPSRSPRARPPGARARSSARARAISRASASRPG